MQRCNGATVQRCGGATVQQCMRRLLKQPVQKTGVLRGVGARRPQIHQLSTTRGEGRRRAGGARAEGKPAAVGLELTWNMDSPKLRRSIVGSPLASCSQSSSADSCASASSHTSISALKRQRPIRTYSALSTVACSRSVAVTSAPSWPCACKETRTTSHHASIAAMIRGSVRSLARMPSLNVPYMLMSPCCQSGTCLPTSASVTTSSASASCFRPSLTNASSFSTYAFNWASRVALRHLLFAAFFGLGLVRRPLDSLRAIRTVGRTMFSSAIGFRREPGRCAQRP